MKHKKPPSELEAIIFDWGDTLMYDYKDKEGPMCTWDSVKVIEGVTECLAHLSKKYKLFVGSNSGYSDTEMLIKALSRGGINTFFSGFFASKDMPYEKPDPRFFKYILEKTAYTPSKVAMCGNDYEKDIVAAKKAGLYTLFYYNKPLKTPYPAADIIFDDFYTLTKVFEW